MAELGDLEEFMYRTFAAIALVLVAGCGGQSNPPKSSEDGDLKCPADMTPIPFSTGKTCVGQEFANMRVCLESSMDSKVVKASGDDVLTSVGVTVNGASSSGFTVGADNAVKLTNRIMATAKPDPNGCNQIKACMATSKVAAEQIQQVACTDK